jgi:hypothetical protein
MFELCYEDSDTFHSVDFFLCLICLADLTLIIIDVPLLASALTSHCHYHNSFTCVRSSHTSHSTC